MKNTITAILFVYFFIAAPTYASTTFEVSEFNYSGDDEYVLLENVSNKTVHLRKWKISDASNHSLTFPKFSLAPNQQIKIFTGEGVNTLKSDIVKIYWNNNVGIWNNDHDTLKVKKKKGKVVLKYQY